LEEPKKTTHRRGRLVSLPFVKGQKAYLGKAPLVGWTGLVRVAVSSFGYLSL